MRHHLCLCGFLNGANFFNIVEVYRALIWLEAASSHLASLRVFKSYPSSRCLKLVGENFSENVVASKIRNVLAISSTSIFKINSLT